MINRKAVIVANWKMEFSHKAATEALASLKKMIQGIEITAEVIICPSYPTLPAAVETLGNSKKILLGAQNVHWEERGAWTGEVSVSQISPFVTHCIVGHSEQRNLTDETDIEVQQQANLLLVHGISPIICIGESYEEREADQTIERVTSQVNSVFKHVTRVSLSKLVMCYEPIWAISARREVPPPDPQEIDQIIVLIRKLAAQRFGQEAAEKLRIIYGGSVDDKNVRGYVGEPGIDGVLVGSASLLPGKFINIIKEVQSVKGK